MSLPVNGKAGLLAILEDNPPKTIQGNKAVLYNSRHMLLPLEGSEPGLCFASLKERRVQMCQNCHRHQHYTKPFSVTGLEGLRENWNILYYFPH